MKELNVISVSKVFIFRKKSLSLFRMKMLLVSYEGNGCHLYLICKASFFKRLHWQVSTIRAHFTQLFAVTILPNRVIFRYCTKKKKKMFIFAFFSFVLFFLGFSKPLEKFKKSSYSGIGPDSFSK